MIRFRDNITRQKLRGGYYTPDVLGTFLARFVVTKSSARVLEPSCGDGALVESVASRLGPSGRVVGIELFEEETAKARQRGGNRAEIVTADVFSWFNPELHRGQFDGAIGNPPFIRYQAFPEQYRDDAMALMRSEGLKPNRLTNAWVPFVVLATIALRHRGRLGFVLPAELLQVSYAAELRSYLARRYTRLHLITFRQLVFQGIQQETVLLLGERGDCHVSRMVLHDLQDEGELVHLQLEGKEHCRLELDHAREKWTQYYLDSRELGLIRELESSPEIPVLGDYADVNVGIVTGKNEFFVLNPASAQRLGIQDSCRPLVGRSAQIPGLVFGSEDYERLLTADSRCLLLQLGDIQREKLSTEARAYVAWGEARGFHRGYKCRIRLPRWWNVPSDWIPDAFMLRQIHDGPRIIANDAAATCTDTMHRVRIMSTVSASALAAASINSLTFSFAEIRGRSYGGGVLELEPREAVGLPFPMISDDLPIEDLDARMREGETIDVLEEVDRLTLKAMGITTEEIEVLRGIWRRLSERRLLRT